MRSLHPAISLLAQKAGVQIKNRAINDGHIFDGSSVGDHAYTKEGKRYLSHLDLLHEIAHFVLAAPEQRDLPEFGLGYVASFRQAYVPHVVDLEECQIQEHAAQMLSVYWGSHFSLSSTLSDNPTYCESWDHYLELKIIEMRESQIPFWAVFARVATFLCL